ncbi:MAG: DUF58 domain-containing protein [Alphaproteobacteria bacterium]|nr:DUF58 domain-containing protein [Alphaproteobacteria bacterium]
MRLDARQHAALFPPLLAEAHRLAASVVMGSHGRRQTGPGEEFWQFRSAMPGDAWRSIDWRRSARSDAHYIRQLEWQAAQSVLFWIDGAQSMSFTGDKKRPAKGARANMLGLAIMILLVKAGERIGLLEDLDPPKSGETQLDRIAAQLESRARADDYGIPDQRIFPKDSRAVFVSDFLGDWAAIKDVLARASDRGVTGALVQILDPVEEAFPFDGRTEFQSMSGAIRFETLRARGLKAAYLDKLAARKQALAEIAARTGWQYLCHHTDQAAQPALMWLYSALEKAR